MFFELLAGSAARGKRRRDSQQRSPTFSLPRQQRRLGAVTKVGRWALAHARCVSVFHWHLRPRTTMAKIARDHLSANALLNFAYTTTHAGSPGGAHMELCAASKPASPQNRRKTLRSPGRVLREPSSRGCTPISECWSSLGIHFRVLKRCSECYMGPGSPSCCGLEVSRKNLLPRASGSHPLEQQPGRARAP